MFDPKLYPNVAEGHQYALDITLGKLPACKWTIGACARYLDDLKRSKKDYCSYYFNPERAEKYLRQVQQFEHVSGHWETPKILYMPWQKFIFMNIKGWFLKESDTVRFRTAHVEIPRGNGKAHPLDEYVPTPEGIKKWGQIKIGSKLYALDGSICTVTNMSPIESMPEYRVTFSDNTSIRCSGEHEWIVSNRDDRTSKTRIEKTDVFSIKLRDKVKQQIASNFTRVVSTKDLMSSIKVGCRNQYYNYSIPLPTPIVSNYSLPKDIDTYVIGLWYGAGLGNSKIYCNIERLQEMAEILRIRGVNFSWKSSLYRKHAFIELHDLPEQLNALGITNREMVLPIVDWSRLPTVQKTDFVAGVLDASGTRCFRGGYHIHSANLSLLNFVKLLLASMGHKSSKPTLLKPVPPYTYTYDRYRLNFTPKKDELFFHSRHKLSHKMTEKTDRNHAGHLFIKSIEATGRDIKMFCVQVDSVDSSYLIGQNHIPTHNSAMASQAVLYDVGLNNPKGNHVYCAATRKEQARIILDAARDMASKNKSFLKATGVKVLAHQITHPASQSYARAISADHKGLDGKIGVLICCDELHAMQRNTFETLDSGQAKRRDSLLLCITTAGYDNSGVGHSQSVYAQKVIDGRIKDETFFAIIYSIDEGDDPYDPLVWKKANPGFGKIVDPINFEAKAKKAKESPQDTNGFLIKHLNVWTNSASPFFNVEKWRENAIPGLKIADFKGKKAWRAIDLASKIDLTATVSLFKENGIYYFFSNNYIPEATVRESKNDLYREWVMDGWLIQTPGEAINYVKIQEDFLKESSDIKVAGVMYDPWNCQEFASRMSMQRLNMLEFKMNTGNVSEPMKRLDALIREGKFKHDGNPLVEWCLSNVVAKVDHNDNVYFRKEHEANKIDPIVAAIMALAGHISEEEASVYETRGIRTL